MKKKKPSLHQIEYLNKTIFEQRGPAKKGSWRGVRAIKYPTDLFLYAELIFKLKVDIVLETGTRFGGSALFLADACRAANKGKVISIEIDETYEIQNHPKLICFKGDSVSPEMVERVFALKKETALVILDSDHAPAHVINELNAYAPLVSVGSYIIVEDLHQEGAAPAVEKWLRANPNFQRDEKVEKYGIHAARRGFLQRVA